MKLCLCISNNKGLEGTRKSSVSTENNCYLDNFFQYFPYNIYLRVTILNRGGTSEKQQPGNSLLLFNWSALVRWSELGILYSEKIGEMTCSSFGFDPFQATIPFLHPLKTSGNLFPKFSGEIELESCCKMGYWTSLQPCGFLFSVGIKM